MKKYCCQQLKEACSYAKPNIQIFSKTFCINVGKGFTSVQKTINLAKAILGIKDKNEFLKLLKKPITKKSKNYEVISMAKTLIENQEEHEKKFGKQLVPTFKTLVYCPFCGFKLYKDIGI